MRENEYNGRILNLTSSLKRLFSCLSIQNPQRFLNLISAKPLPLKAFLQQNYFPWSSFYENRILLPTLFDCSNDALIWNFSNYFGLRNPTKRAKIIKQSLKKFKFNFIILQKFEFHKRLLGCSTTLSLWGLPNWPSLLLKAFWGVLDRYFFWKRTVEDHSILVWNLKYFLLKNWDDSNLTLAVPNDRDLETKQSWESWIFTGSQERRKEKLFKRENKSSRFWNLKNFFC